MSCLRLCGWQVFRTYNASITLDRLLADWEAGRRKADQSVDEKKVDYDLANKEVCMHVHVYVCLWMRVCVSLCMRVCVCVSAQPFAGPVRLRGPSAH